MSCKSQGNKIKISKEQKITDKSSLSNPGREEIHIYCIARCSKCLVDTLAEQQRIDCRVCTSPLEYYCTLCDKQFSNLGAVRNHVIKGLGEISTFIKCSKCFRTEFSTKCSFIKHQRYCNTSYRFDKEIVLRLERRDFQLELINDIKPPIPLLPIQTNENQCADSIETYVVADETSPYGSDDLEIKEEFKIPFTFTNSTSDVFYPKQADNRFSNDLEVGDEHETQFTNALTTSVCQSDPAVPAVREKTSLPIHSLHGLDENQNLGIDDGRNSLKAKPRDHNSANKCSNCQKIFSRAFYLERHSKICGQTEDCIRSLMLRCDHCNYKTVQKSSLAIHIQTKHLPRDLSANKCKKCKKNFSKRSNLLQHSKICGQPKNVARSFTITCDYCNYKTLLKTNLTRHIQAKHLPRDPNANKCSKCNKSYSQQSHLLRHTRICGQSEEIKNSFMFFCDHCNYKTINKSNFRRHIQEKHLPRDPDANKCYRCQKNFCDESYLREHSKICGQPKDVVSSLMLTCDHCNYKTLFKGNITRHVQARHLPRDPIANKCNKCGKNFCNKLYLQKHSKICDSKYKIDAKSNRRKHIQGKHLSRDPDANKCQRCKKNFSQRSNLLTHLKICGQPKDFIRSLMRLTCDHCNYKSNRKSNIIRHIQAKHVHTSGL